MLNYFRGEIMKNNTIKIEVKDNKVSFGSTSPLSIQDATQTLLTVLEGMCQQCIKHTPNLAEEVRNSLFDFLNQAFSSTLYRIDPEGDLHPTLTTQAILEAENAIIMEGRLDKVKHGT